MTALELGRKIRNREMSAVEAVEMTFHNIEQKGRELNCFIFTDKEYAMQQAKQIQLRLEHGEGLSPLAGVPVAVKDNICVKDIPTTCGSKMLEGFIPPYHAEVISRMQDAGMIILGKTNMDEFAMGSTTETSIFGASRNPHNPKHSTGGSSGGSCGAVAAGTCGMALGSDTGGSVRQPAGHCGVVGFKPTYGTVSRYGLVAYASSMDQIGPVTVDVSDCAAVLEIISGQDKKDSTSREHPDYGFTNALRNDVQGMRIGIPKEYMTEECDETVRTAILQASEEFRKYGAVVEECSLPLTRYATAIYYIIVCAEAGSNLARYDGVKYGYRGENYNNLHSMYKESRREGFGWEVKRRILLGTYVLSSGYYEKYYLKAMKARSMLGKELKQAFQTYDLLLMPTAASTAPLLGESLKNPLNMYRGDIYTTVANLTGVPAISVPCGKDKQGLPIGMQLMGNHFRENTILQAAYTFEAIRR